ncbi:MAG: hypothetical protein FWF96_05095, partial [Kiritimatiellaeota bacterium]|nr:hypothetical protein [Kiritimatiellota bacterium]
RRTRTDDLPEVMRDFMKWRPRVYAVVEDAPLFSSYVANRVLGDEARYIMERRHRPPQTGVMLARPSLLLAPWSVVETQTLVIEAEEGAAWEPSSDRPGGMRGAVLGRYGGSRALNSGDSVPPPLDFLERPALMLANLEPLDNVVSIPLEQLAEFNEICVVAADAARCDWRVFTLPRAAMKTTDLRFKPAFAGDAAVAQQRVISTRAEIKIPEESNVTAFETFDSLARVFAYFQALGHDPVFAKFEFLCAWQGLDLATKQKKYDEFACHELNFFLWMRDRAFFDAVVKPFITDKRDKQVVDDFLLGNDLASYLQPLKFQQLNTFEKILLAQKVAQAAPILRDLAETVALIPPDDAAWERAFNVALDTSAMMEPMEESDGVELRQKRARGEFAANADKVLGAAPPPPPAMDALKREEKSNARKLLLDGDIEMDFDESGLFMMDRDLREELTRPLFRSPAATREWVETHYHQTPLARINASLITPSAFWRDFAQHAPGAPFLPASLADAARSTPERLLALALVDLPETPDEQNEKAIVFAEYTVARERADVAPLPIVQTFFDAYDRFGRDAAGAGQIEKTLSQDDEFFACRAYGMSVILSNPSGRPRRARLLASVPAGAVALRDSRELLARPVALDAYSIQRFELFFYFPEPGDHDARPASVSEDGRVVSVASPFTCHVRAAPAALKLDAWQDLARNGAVEQVLAFLETQNLRDPAIDLKLARSRLLDKDFYTRLNAFLESRLVFDKTVASFAFLHGDLDGAANYVTRFAPAFHASLGPRFVSPFISYDAEAGRVFEQQEYWPLINARAHPLKKQRVIANQNFAAHYAGLMDFLAFTPERGERDTMAVVCALLLQDRTPEARAFFDTINVAQASRPMSLQHDYTLAYLDYAEGKLDAARALAATYADYPVARWRERFAEIVAHVDEARGEGWGEDSGEGRPGAWAGEAPALSASLAGGVITILASNAGETQIRYYPLDIEELFSRAPFLASNPASFGNIRPARVETPGIVGGVAEVEIPRDLAAQNLLIEITSPDAPMARRLSHTPNSMAVGVLEASGQLRVRAAGAPLPGAYVKVYARDAGHNEVFYKDGYTDPRGAFDYASLSTDTLRGARRFALLVTHPAHGAFITEADPPPR